MNDRIIESIRDKKISHFHNLCDLASESNSIGPSQYAHIAISYTLRERYEDAELIILNVSYEYIDDPNSVIIFSNTIVVSADIFQESNQYIEELATRQLLKFIDNSNLDNKIRLLELLLLNKNEINIFKKEEILELFGTKSFKKNIKRLKIILTELLFKYDFDCEDLCQEIFKVCLYSQDLLAIIYIIAKIECSKIKNFDIGVRLLEFCLKHNYKKIEIGSLIPRFYFKTKDYNSAIESSKFYLQNISNSEETNLIGYALLFRALLISGEWEEYHEIKNIFEMKIKPIINKEIKISKKTLSLIILTVSYFSYIEDEPKKNRQYLTSLNHLFDCESKEIVKNSYVSKKKYPDIQNKIKPRIGYIGSTFRAHSVGWLSRWLFSAHNKENYDIYIYALDIDHKNLFFEKYFSSAVTKASILSGNADQIANRIQEDGIDILIEVDSVTSSKMLEILSFRPCKIQISWLGWDSSGHPEIDYFLADQYVIESNTEKYYTEKLLKLKESYVAVQGFEVGIPTLRRSDLNIPEDAIIYMTCQSSSKINAEMIDCYAQVLTKVPNSYLLIKGLKDNHRIQNNISSVLNSLGISNQRYIFVEYDQNEFTHRANLGFADVMLDTYPYNGATTTLETLWACVPLVTRKGKQFASRNSYAFMKHMGIEAGIGINKEDYISWAVKLGKDKELRALIKSKMKRAKGYSNLWNPIDHATRLENLYDLLLNQGITEEERKSILLKQ